ncbi:unnamed protein product [Caenorhabditis brenneri]
MYSTSSEEEEYYDPVFERTFAKSHKTDAILVVDGKKLHVNKALLSYHSDYFKALFNSEFKEKSMEEIPIEDVKFEDFATLLSIVHDHPLEITKSNAANLLKLADRFLLNTPKRLIANLVKISPEFSRYEKLILADEHQLDDLFDHALKLYDSKETFLDFAFTTADLSDSSKAKIFDELFWYHCRIFE